MTFTAAPPSTGQRGYGSRKATVTLLTLGILGSLGAVAGTVAATPASAAASHTVHVSPAQTTGSRGFSKLLEALRPGQTLVLRPGTYNIGVTRPEVRSGTRSAPITVTASDPSRTVIRGQLKLWDADYWHLKSLRFQAGVRGAEALYIGGGRGWRVTGSEFSGADRTGAYANVAIGSGYRGEPRDFRFTRNCLHGAGRTARSNTDHNLYVAFAGNSRTGGTIDRNIIFNHPNGAGIKLGNGGLPGARGPWGVKVLNNTIAFGGRQVLLHGDVRGNLIQGNLLAVSTARFVKSPKTTAIYANMVTTRTNKLVHNYVYRSSMVAFDPQKRLVAQGKNTLRTDPSFTRIQTCKDWQTRNPAARPYGKFGTARF